MRLSTSSLVLAALAGLVGCAPEAPTGAVADAGAPAFAQGVAHDQLGWAPAVRVDLIPGAYPAFNTPSLDGCPFPSRDGKMFFIASNRPGGLGGIDIWVATRESADDPWGAPVNVGAPVNSAANDFCPTLARDGHTFYFISNRAGGCGGDDIYTTRLRDDRGFDAPEHLACDADGGPNSAGNEASPVPAQEPGSGRVLFFSSTRAGGPGAEAPGVLSGDADIYKSEWQGGAFGPAALVPVVNSAFNDGQPNVTRDVLELFFFSNRPGTLGGNDIYSATRAKAHDAWSEPRNLGPNVNSAAGDETRPSPTWDGGTLYFGSTRPGVGSTDIYVTTRLRQPGKSNGKSK